MITLSAKRIEPTERQAGRTPARPFGVGIEEDAFVLDRDVYREDDPVGLAVAEFRWIAPGPAAPPIPAPPVGDRIDFRIVDGVGTLLGRTVVSLATAGQTLHAPRAKCEIQLGSLGGGSYRAVAVLMGVNGALTTLERQFETGVRPPPAVQIPVDGIALKLHPGPPALDGLWPISTGIPFPVRALRDPASLQLTENGVAVPMQLTPRALWHPDESIRWLGLDFNAHYDAGIPREYVLRTGVPATIADPVRVRTDHDKYTVDTGALQFVVGRSRFSGLSRCSTGARGRESVLVEASEGPYIEDTAGIRYLARNDARARVEIEEAGPLRITIRASGRYVSSGGLARCRFVCRISAFAGQSRIELEHRTILLDAADGYELRDVGWAIRVTRANSARFGVDGQVHPFTLHAGTTLFARQDKYDHLHIQELGGAPGIDGTRSDGWVVVAGSQFEVAAFVRGVADRFPKEVSLAVGQPTASGDPDVSMTVHTWPAHGVPVARDLDYSASPGATAYHRANVYKLWWAHQGPRLDLRVPAQALSLLGHLAVATGSDNNWPNGDDSLAAAELGDGVGVCLSSEFSIRVTAPRARASVYAAEAAAFEAHLHAVANAEWNAATLVEGRVAPKIPGRHTLIENTVHDASPTYQRVICEAGGEHGMWIYGGVHDAWMPHLFTTPAPPQPPHSGAAQLHRVWQASHYRNVWAAWLMYFRSGDLPAWRWAKATSDLYQDVGTVHPDAWPMGERALAMRHAYGFTPWGSVPSHLADYRANWSHFIDPDGYRLRWLLTGSGWSRELYQQWIDSLANSDMRVVHSSRDGINTLGALLSAFEDTWDPNVLLWWRASADATFQYYANPTEPGYRFKAVNPNWHEHPVWHRQWPGLYWTRTRDSRIVDYVDGWLREGGQDACAFAFMAIQRSEPKLLSEALAGLVDAALTSHGDPGDRYHGYSAIVKSGHGAILVQESPYLLSAADLLGVDPVVAAALPRRMMYPGGPHRTEWDTLIKNEDMTDASWLGMAATSLVLVDVPANTAFDVQLRSVRDYGDLAPGFVHIRRGSDGTVAQRHFFTNADPDSTLSIEPEDITRWWIEARAYQTQFLAP